MTNTNHNHPPSLGIEKYRKDAEQAIKFTDKLPWGEKVAEHTGQQLNIFKYQMYYNIIHNEDIWVDGKAWVETISAINNHIKPTQIFLRELWAKNADGTPLTVDGNVWKNTKEAIKKYFGIDIEKGVKIAVIDIAEKSIEDLKNLSDADLLKKLNKSDADFKKAVSEWERQESAKEKRCYLTEFARRFLERDWIVESSFDVYNTEWETVTTGISQTDLQSIMVLNASTWKEVNDRSIFEKNVANNIFDTTIAKFDLKNPNGKKWIAQDFVADGKIIKQEEADKNKSICIDDIEKQIGKLQEENKNTTVWKKETNLIWIQKLEVAKVFVTDQEQIATESLEFAQSVVRDTNNIVRLFPSEYKKDAEDALASGDLRKFLVNQTPRLVMAGVLAFIANFLPKGFREWAFALIAAVAWLWMNEDAKAMGYDIMWKRTGETQWVNPAEVKRDDWDMWTDKISTILTKKPKGLEPRHYRMYAYTVKQNNETPVFRSRDKLNKSFLYASQDSNLSKLDANSVKDLDAETIKELVHPITKQKIEESGIGYDQFLKTVRMVCKISQEKEWNNDKTVGDMFVEWQLSEKKNRLSYTWIQWYDAINRDINAQIENLSGIGLWVEWVDSSENVKYQVQKALTKAQPDLFEWTGNTFVAFVTAGASITPPKVGDVKKVIDALNDINTTNQTDKTAIGKIKEIYEKLENSLKAHKTVQDYVDKTSRYTKAFPGTDMAKDAVNSVSNGITSIISYFWASAALIPGEIPETKPSDLKKLIEEWQNLNIGSMEISQEEKDELQKKVDTQVQDLQNMLAALYGKLASDGSLDADSRKSFEREEKNALISVINSDPEAMLKEIRDKSESISEISNKYNTLSNYSEVLYKNAVSLKSIRAITVLDVNQLDGEAKDVHSEAMKIIWGADSLFETFKTNVTSKRDALKALIPNDTEIGSADRQKLEWLQKNWEKVENSVISDGAIIKLRELAHTYLWVPNWQTRDYNNTLDIITSLVRKIEWENSSFDLSGASVKEKLDKSKQSIENRKQTLDESIDVNIKNPDDVEESEDIQTFIKTVKEKEKEVDSMQEWPIKKRKTEAIQADISLVVDDMRTKLDTYNSGNLDEIAKLDNLYQTLSTSIGNGENDSFEQGLKEKYAEFGKEKVLSQTIWDAPKNVTDRIQELITKYKNDPIINSTLVPEISNTTTMKDFFKTMNIIIQSLENQVASNALGNQTASTEIMIKDLKSTKRALYLLLVNNYGATYTRWVKETFGKDIPEYFDALLNT